LLMFAEDRFEKIDAKIVDAVDVHRQSVENAARRGLNAVAKARQLALLIMDMYGNEQFEEYSVCVAPGECDRNFYIQAANYDIKRGYAPRLMAETGFANRQMVSRYRNILNLPDLVWVQADEESWSEKRCRDYLERQRIIKAEAECYDYDLAWDKAHEEADRLQREDTNLVKIAENEDAPAYTPMMQEIDDIMERLDCEDDMLPSGDISDEIMPGDWVRTTVDGDALVSFISHDGVWAYIWIAGNKNRATIAYEAKSLVKIIDGDCDEPPVISDIITQSDEVDEWSGCELSIGDRVKTKNGLFGEVMGFTHNYVFSRIKIDGIDGIRDIATSTLTMVGRTLVVEPATDDDADESMTYSYETMPPTVADDDRSIAYMEQLGEIGDAHHDDINQEIGVNYVDSYVPETLENSNPFVNGVDPALGRLLKALRSWQHSRDVHWPESEWALDDLTVSESGIKHKIGLNDEMAAAHSTTLKASIKTMQTLLNEVFDEIRQLADDLNDVGQSCHEEIWGDDDE